MCWSTKSAICLKRVKIEEKLLWRAYIGTQQRSFKFYHSRPPAASGSSSPQNWGCNAPKPLWSSRLPIPIRSEVSPLINETFKRKNFITHHQLQCKQISDSHQAFLSTQQSNIHNNNFSLRHAKLGWRWGCNCTPCSNVEPPLPGASSPRLGVRNRHPISSLKFRENDE